MDNNIEEIKRNLKRYHQEHLWDFYEKLEGKNKEKFLEQLKKIDFSLIDSLYKNTKKELTAEELNVVVTVAVPTIIMILFIQVILTEMKTTFKDIAYTFIGIFYIVFFIMFIAFINGMPNGKILIWYPLIAAWGTDISAYIIGKKFGKHKFSKISPKKSIEGAIAGVIGAVLLALAYTYIANTYWNMNIQYIYI